MSVTFNGDKELANALNKMARTEVYKKLSRRMVQRFKRQLNVKQYSKKGIQQERLGVPLLLI